MVEEVAGIKLGDAEIAVAGGWGIGSAEGFQQLGELVGLLKGALGASRPPCVIGWVPDTLQIGLTGKIIAPELYIAVALSDSSQHMSGCSGSKNIIAINKDAEANIFPTPASASSETGIKYYRPLRRRLKSLKAGSELQNKLLALVDEI